MKLNNVTGQPSLRLSQKYYHSANIKRKQQQRFYDISINEIL